MTHHLTVSAVNAPDVFRRLVLGNAVDGVSYIVTGDSEAFGAIIGDGVIPEQARYDGRLVHFPFNVMEDIYVEAIDLHTSRRVRAPVRFYPHCRMPDGVIALCLDEYDPCEHVVASIQVRP